MSGHTGHGLHSHFINHHLYLGTEKSAPGENDGGYLKGERERKRDRGVGGGVEVQRQILIFLQAHPSLCRIT